MAGKIRTIRIADHPILSKIWDSANNAENPNDYGIGNSTHDFAWICPICHKSFKAKPNSVVNTGLCPECAYKEGAKKRIERKLKSGKYTSVADDDFLSKYWAKDLNSVSPDTITNGANKKYIWYCPQCGNPFERKVSQMKIGTGLCKDCSQKQGTAKHEVMMLADSKAISDVPELMADWDENNLLDPTKVSYGSTKTAYWICRKCKKSFPRKISNQFHSMTHFCEECAAKLRHEEHRKSMAKYNETIADRPNMMALWDWDNNTRDPHDLSAKSGIRVYWKCKCGETWKEKPCDRYNLLPHCMKCSMRLHNDRKNRRAIEKGGTWGGNHPKLAKQWHPTLNGNVTPYDITPNCCTPYYFLCEYGHAYKAEPRERALNHAGCPICNAGRRTSFAEQTISFYLGKVVKVKSNHPIMNHSELDVFIPELPSSTNNKAAIEFDGAFWHSRKYSAERDARKDEYCRNNGIRLIRVKEAEQNKKIDSNLFLFDRKGNDYQWLIDELCNVLDLPTIKVDIVNDTPEILERLNIVDVETSLAKKRPDALAYWNYKENAPMKPEKVGYTSCHVFAWHCPKCGNDFMDKVSAVTGRIHICKECGKKLKGINISKAKRKMDK